MDGRTVHDRIGERDADLDRVGAVCRGGGKMRRRGALSLWLGSLVNVSAGGSAGLESPIVYSGATIGSTIGGLPPSR